MPSSARSTERLIEEWQAGRDRDTVFRALFERYYPPVAAYFRKRFSPLASDDLAQETFLRVYRGMGSFRHGSSFETWLFTIARNLGVHHSIRATSEFTTQELASRETKSEEEVGEGGDEETGLLDSRISPEEEALDREREELLRAAVNELPPQMRQCMALRVNHSLKYREIAEVLGISIQTVKSHLSQAKTRLKEELGDRSSDVGID